MENTPEKDVEKSSTSNKELATKVALALIVPGGLIALAGYLLYKMFKSEDDRK